MNRKELSCSWFNQIDEYEFRVFLESKALLSSCGLTLERRPSGKKKKTIYLFTTTTASPVDVKKAIAVNNRPTNLNFNAILFHLLTYFILLYYLFLII